VTFKVAAFTNLTQDHLDYHGDMIAYGEAKRRLFDWAGLRAAVINVDDAFGADLYSSLEHAEPQLKIITTGFSLAATLRASDVRVQADASQTFTVSYQGRTYPAQLAALGQFNVHNALTALGCVLALGYDEQHAIALLPQLHAVAGRMQVVSTAAQASALHPLVVVDFAHTPDGLSQALQALRPVANERGGALHAVFGCGGNRDAGKRSVMGAIAHQHADRITITNDNPRDEDAADIAAHIAAAAPGARIELDRATAIAHAIQKAHRTDVILIAGKGHETTQTIAGLVTAFSDVAQAQAVLKALEVRS
jgi:UDP-N-acetylmuramoyl-L-alanyl-D-glutamate--2,6-diaminopimelate ligase